MWNTACTSSSLLRRTFLQKTSAFGIDEPGVVVATRCNILVVKRKGSRSIQNHDKLIDAIRTSLHSCAISIHTGHESVRTQLTMFRSSTVIIAPHGAGLSNIVVCRKNTAVLEVMVTGQAVNLCYMAMALKLKLRHVALYPWGPFRGGKSSQHTDMVVDVEKAISSVRDVLYGL